jgi:endonuclease/exonuclease/phosphatase (EEP) superfamily protein YafD
MLKLRPFFTSLVLPLLLAACTSIPTQNILTSGDGSSSLEGYSSCLFSSSRMTAPAATVSGSLDPAYIDLLVWNIYKGQLDGWLQDLDVLSRGRDLLLLQEVKLDGEIRGMLAETVFYWQHATAFRYLKMKTGVMTASVAAPVFHCMYRISEPLIRIPKAVLVTRYALTNRQHELLVINVHGINFELNDNGFRTQINAMRQLLDKHDGPAIMAGDFNTWSQGRIDNVLELAQATGLRQLHIDSDNRSRSFGNVIDLIFYRGLRPLHASSIPVGTSDHNPLVASFSLDDREESYLWP